MTSTLERSDTVVLSVDGLSKDFQGQRALDNVDLQLRSGEVHCLLGQNGSGKSTFVKILAGYHSPGAGARATAHGQPLDLGSAAAADAAGLRFIHQDLALIDGLSVVDNLALGRSYSRSLWISERVERQAASRALARYGVAVDASATVASLGQAEKTLTAIVRALHRSDAGQSILVLDEPTASLPETSREHLFRLIRDIVGRGGTVLYVTHRLEEVFEIGDRVSVLRDGRRIATRDVAELDHNQLVLLIVGREVESMSPDAPARTSEVALEVTNLAGGDLDDFSVSVHSGEIVGVVGLTGSGVDDVTHLVFGAKPARSGTVSVTGTPVDGSPSAAIRAGVAFVPADRKRLGGIPDWPLSENLTLPSIPRATVLRWLSPRRERAMSRAHLSRFKVSPADPAARFSSLSGGNQQKVMIARSIRCGGKVLLLEEPTAGVDVGAKVAIYDAIRSVAATTRTAVLLTTSDFEEACSICDRVLVVRDGRVVATLSGSARTSDHILSEALGVGVSDNPAEPTPFRGRPVHETRSYTS